MTSVDFARFRSPVCNRNSMLTVYNCIVTEHDLRLVGLGRSDLRARLVHRRSACFIMCADRPVTCGSLARRLRDVDRFGIWATHFIAMLAFSPGLPSAYNIALDRSFAGRRDRAHRHRSGGRHRAQIGRRQHGSAASSWAAVLRPCTISAWRRSRFRDASFGIRLWWWHRSCSAALHRRPRAAGRAASAITLKWKASRRAAADPRDLQPSLHRDGRGFDRSGSDHRSSRRRRFPSGWLAVGVALASFAIILLSFAGLALDMRDRRRA